MFSSSATGSKNNRAFSYITSLDGVRALAVLVVFFHHIAFTSINDLRDTWPGPVRFIANLFREGQLGVDLFFVLSGFLITTLLLKDRRKPGQSHEFYVKRAFRILPALLLSLVVGYGVGYLNAPTVLLSLVFLTNYAHLFHFTATGPYWTLAVEEQFYIVWPILVRKLSFKALHWVLLALVLVEPLVRYFANAHGHHTMYYTYLRADSLAMGAWLGASTYYHRIYSSPERARAWWRRYGRGAALAGGVALGAQALAMNLGLLGAQTNTTLLTAAPLLFTGVLAYLVTHGTALVPRLLSTRPLRFFGDISYGLYLIHLTVMNVYDRATGFLNHPVEMLPYTVRLVTILGVSTGLAALSLYAFERPLMRKRQCFLEPSPKAKGIWILRPTRVGTFFAGTLRRKISRSPIVR